MRERAPADPVPVAGGVGGPVGVRRVAGAGRRRAHGLRVPRHRRSRRRSSSRAPTTPRPTPRRRCRPGSDLTPDEAIAEYEHVGGGGHGGAARRCRRPASPTPSCRSATSASSRCTCWPTPWCSTTTATCATTSARPIERAAELPQDAGSLDATLEWMWAGLPQMCAEQLAGCDTGVNIVLDGPGGGSWQVRPGGDGWTVEPGTDPDLPTARSTAHDFVSWGTAARRTGATPGSSSTTSGRLRRWTRSTSSDPRRHPHLGAHVPTGAVWARRFAISRTSAAQMQGPDGGRSGR